MSGHITALLAETGHILFLVALETGINLLTVGQGYLVTCLEPAFGDSDRRDTHHIHSHIVDVGMAVGAVDGHHLSGSEDFAKTHHLIVAGYDVEVDPVSLLDALCCQPGAVVEARESPAFHDLGSVVPLSLEETAVAHRTVLESFPAVRI